MTRINAGIKPTELTDKHLLSEHREIKRIPNAISKGRFSLKGQPQRFTLGTGHVKFFYTRLKYLKKRYESLYKECKRRGFNVTYYGNAWDNIPEKFMNGYRPNKEDRRIVMERIKERLKSSSR